MIIEFIAFIAIFVFYKLVPVVVEEGLSVGKVAVLFSS